MQLLSPRPDSAPFARPRTQGTPAALLAAGLLALATACAGDEPGPDVSGEEGPLSATDTPLTGILSNGILSNGILSNGLSVQGPVNHGLVAGGLSDATLAGPGFNEWARGYPEGDVDMVMRYLVACAVPEGELRAWSSPVSGTTYSWQGRLGLTPSWAGGLPATETEQQLASACLAAMVNKYGLHVLVSVRGRAATGQELAHTPEEDALFSIREAAFFGNLFTGEGVYTCHDRSVLSPSESSPRACGISAQGLGPSVECPPLEHVGVCPSLCRGTPGQDYYTRCTLNGKDYVPLTTRLRQQDIFQCGDGVCQLTESCDDSLVGEGTSYERCSSDCGRCAQ